MKRTREFWANGRHQLLKQLSRTAKNSATFTILNVIQVHLVVMNTQDHYCELWENSHLTLEAGVFCVIWQKKISNKNY